MQMDKQIVYNGIGHVAFNCSDLDVSLDFYCNKMGFERIMHLGPDSAPWLVYLRIVHGVYMELFPFPKGAKKCDDGAGRCYSHLCLDVPDIFAAVSVLRSRGVEVEDPHMGGDGNYQAWLADPDGNRMELMQMMPDSMQRQADKA